MSYLEKETAEDSISSSDESLEDVNFLQLSSTESRYQTSSEPEEKITEQTDVVESIGSRLDALLFEEKEEIVKNEQHQQMKQQLLHSLEKGSQDDTITSDNESLHGDLAQDILNLEVSSPSVSSRQLALCVFDPSKACLLFQENIAPIEYAFSRLFSSKIDKVLARLKPDGLTALLVSGILPASFHHVTSPNCVMMWLLSVLSVHSSPMVVDLVFQNMVSIINGQNKKSQYWWPRPIELIRIFVNMGADPTSLLGSQTYYSKEVVKVYLYVQNDENKNRSTTSKSSSKIRIENFDRLLQIVTKCFQMKPDCSKEELNIMIDIVLKVSVDSSFQCNLDLCRSFQACLSSLMDCYRDPDWSSVVPSLCHQFAAIPNSPATSVYIVNLLPITPRGNYLQIRLSFLLLCKSLEPGRHIEQSTLALDKISPLTISELGRKKMEETDSSPLSINLQNLIKEDVVNADSVLTLLDRAVGDESNRCSQPKEELDFLINEVKNVVRDIRDRVNSLDLSKLKDKMTVMTVKWQTMSLALTKSVQRNLFSWMRTSRVVVPEEKLEANLSSVCDDEMEL